jgi:chromosome segregation ATPase
MLYLSLLGLGAIAGYGAFYALFNARCLELVQGTKARHNASLEELRRKYDEAVAGKNQCLSDTSAQEELHQLQGRLEAQTALLVKQEETAARLKAIQEEKDKSTQQLASLQNELKEVRLKHHKSSQQMASLQDELNQAQAELEQVNRELTDAIAQKELSEASLTEKLQSTERALSDRELQVTSLLKEQERCGMLPALDEELKNIKEFLLRRSLQLCRLEYVCSFYLFM